MPQLRVLSYNVKSFADDRAALVRVVRHSRPDVLVAQEAPSLLRWRPKCAAFARACGMLYIAGGRTAGGNLLLVNPRVATFDAGTRRIPQRFRDPIRGLVTATLGIGAARLGLVGLHLGLRRLGRAMEVRHVLRGLAEFGDVPVVVAGDFNEPVGGPSWQAMEAAGLRDPGGVDSSGRSAGGVDSSGRSAGGVDSSGRSADGIDSSGRSEGATFPSNRPTSRIDAILTSENVDVKEYGVPDDPEIRTDLRRATDHLPVLAVLEL